MATITTTELIETGEKRDTLGRRRTPVERRAELLAAYRQSGLTQVAFVRREGIRYSTFCTWAQAERRNGKLPVAPAGRKRRRRAAETPAVRFVDSTTNPGGVQLKRNIMINGYLSARQGAWPSG
jgi:transposase-like protein